MIQLHTDHYFHIGNKHLITGKPCQDYAISDVHNNVALAVVSDGCSTGRHTDVGSRILALSTATAIREHWTISCDALGEAVPQEISLRQRIVLSGTRQALGLQLDDMLATCVYAYVSPSGGFVHVQGDGVVAFKYRSGGIDMFRLEWEDNIPYYPAYYEGRLPKFIENHGGDLNALRLSRENCAWTPNEGFTTSDTDSYTLSGGIRGITIDLPAELLSQDLEFIAVFSDGVAQIEKLDWKKAVVIFMAFKNKIGEFAKRRMIRGIKDAQKDGKGLLDDIAYAVIRVEQSETEGAQNAKD
ncbi:protein phosphatase 2C domain-containing protein [Patescibacteria group bacterium]|nr:protein phosphatase 2C domain-containing protein [Patescibacteria group bacterium]MBU4511739.1 protein phosphatase 2C domain-containing protein [Patescibacteria group bacterium]MCG2692822.1 protein phosphatase 2C domain-containing protein [Candidatus Parcubacteria bacterium]